jgi:hypothetical protein
MKTNVYLWSYVAHSSSNEECIRQKLYRKSKHTFLFSNFFSFKNKAVNEIMWKTIIDPDRSQMSV